MKTVQELINEGAMMGTPFTQPVLVSYGSIKDGTLFWVTVFPDGPQDAHWLYFEEMKPVGDIGIEFYSSKEFVGYLALISEWPEIDPFYTQTLWKEWKEQQKDATAQNNFDRFLAFQNVE